MGRKILFVTTDQMRFDALGCNGGSVARTPTIDGWAEAGVRYTRAHPQNVVCMPSRATMVTGQHIRTHGVWMNGVPLRADAPSVAAVLGSAGYRTALFGKAHFEPFLDPFLRFPENQMGRSGEFGPHRGFDHMELAAHGATGLMHYAQWMMRTHPTAARDYYPALDGRTMEVSAATGGETGAVQTKVNPIPRELYHTEWVADRAIAWLDGLDADDDWFCWVSFPDPHHPWDPPESEMHRVAWRDVPLPAGYIEDPAEREKVLDAKARHWGMWYRGELVSNYEAPADWAPHTLTADQVREINARTHVENELIDEALGRVMAAVEARGWGDDLDVVFTTDHGEFQGDYGLLFKGPYHVDSLMRLPLIWRPAPSAARTPTVVDAPVGLIDLAPTFCTIAGVEVPSWMEGRALPESPADAANQHRELVVTEWDSMHPTGVEVHLQTVASTEWVCTRYEAGTAHDGTEGELYDLGADPLQQVNRWSDPAVRPIRDDLVSAIDEILPARLDPLPRVQAPV